MLVVFSGRTLGGVQSCCAVGVGHRKSKETPHRSLAPFFFLLPLVFALVVSELRMDHYVISRQAFNCFRDERASERG